jgi:hypothetical protein
VDAVGVTPAQAGAAVAVWTGVGLLGDLLLIPLLERVRGLNYLRLSALMELVLFPAFLLVPTFWVKLVLLGFLGLFNAGWYSILKAQLYSAMPGQSGTVMTVSNVFGLVVIPPTKPRAIARRASSTFAESRNNVISIPPTFINSCSLPNTLATNLSSGAKLV